MLRKAKIEYSLTPSEQHRCSGCRQCHRPYIPVRMKSLSMYLNGNSPIPVFLQVGGKRDETLLLEVARKGILFAVVSSPFGGTESLNSLDRMFLNIPECRRADRVSDPSLRCCRDAGGRKAVDLTKWCASVRKVGDRSGG